MTESELVHRVRRRLAADAAGAGALAAPQVAAAVRLDRAVLADEAALTDLQREVLAELSGAGPLEPLLATPGVSDVLVNGPNQVWFDRGNGLERAEVSFPDDAAVRRLAQRLAGAAGRRIDDASPFVDATMADGTRVHAILPPLSEWTTLSLRVLARRVFTPEELVLPEVAEALRACVAARLTLLISGGTASGKTTLLGALLATVPTNERILLIEDTRELVIRHPHVVRLVARGANVEGGGEVSLRDLVRQALRMRPDRLVVGEFRGAELAELLLALNTGHEGGAATVHANGVADVSARLTALGALTGLPDHVIARQASSALDIVVQLRRRSDGSRGVAELGLVTGSESMTVVPVWSEWSGPGPGAAALRERLQRQSVPVPWLLR